MSEALATKKTHCLSHNYYMNFKKAFDYVALCAKICWLPGKVITVNCPIVSKHVIQILLLLLNACVRVADVMTFTFVSLMPVHNVCRICMIIKE